MSVVNKYIDSNNFLTAISVYNEEGLLTLAVDGYYQNNAIYRRQLNGLLGPSVPCESCSPAAEPCGVGTTIPSGQTGYYNLDFDTGGTPSDTGAVVVYFNPASIPDGVRVLYNNNYYNTLTNNTDGRIQSTSGVSDAFTMLGSSTDTCVPSTPDTRAYTFFNGIVSGAWNNTGTTQNITINTGDDVRGGQSQFSTLVIPKPNATPNIISIQILGPCASTAWTAEVSCPGTLPGVLASGPGLTDDCQSTQNTSVYFAQNYNDINTAPIVGNFVFLDGDGVTPLNNTSTVQYYITGTIAFSVLNGVVVSSTTCTPPAPDAPAAVALNDSNFYTARDLWFTDQAQAEATYGLIENWNTTAVTTLSSAFYGGLGVVTNDFNKDISGWDVSNVTNMSNVVRAQPLFNQPIGAWDTSNVEKFIYCFYSATGFDQDMSNWNILSSWTVLGMFNGVNLSTVNYDLLLVSWEAQLQGAYPNGVGYSSRAIQFGGGSQYTGFGAGGAARASLVNTFNWTFTDGGDAAALTNSNFNTAIDLWFTNQAQAEAEFGLIGDWNTTAVTNMESAFQVTGVVTNTFNEDISNWDTSNVLTMKRMFSNSSSFNQDISSWDTSKVTHFGQIFYNASSFNQPIGSWNVANVTNLWNALNGANNLNQDLSSWNVNKVSNMDSTFINTSLDTINYDLMLIGWEATLQSQFPNGAGYSKTPGPSFGNVKYTGSGSASTARASLVSNFNWTITDGGIV